jgi:hypothetical protein
VSRAASIDGKPSLLAVPHFDSLPAPKTNSERALREANEHLRENIARKSIRAYEMADRGLKVCSSLSFASPSQLQGFNQPPKYDVPDVSKRRE